MLNLEFFLDELPEKKVYLVDMSILSILLSPGQDVTHTLTAQLGTPRGRYDEHINKSSLSMKPRFIEPVGERTNF
jgi:hypothetical protein